MNRLNKSQLSVSAGGTETFNGVVGITSSATIKAWAISDTPPYTPKFNKNVALKVIGKSSIVKTKASSFVRYYLANSSDVFLLKVWQDQLEAVWDDLGLNSIVRLSNLRIQQLYKDGGATDHSKLWQGGEFIYTKDSKVSVLREGSLIEYPSINDFPPYWCILSTVKENETDIAMRVLVLTLPQACQVNPPNDNARVAAGMRFEVGDGNGNKANCYVECDDSISEEKELMEAIKAGIECLICCAKTLESNGKLAIFIESPEFVMPSETKKLRGDEKPIMIAFSDVKRSAKSPATSESASKKKRSFF